MPEKSLSSNKQYFKINHHFDSERLEEKDLVFLASDYSHRYGITIYVHGYLDLPQEIYFEADTGGDDKYKNTILAVNDILNIQKTLVEGQYVGYLFNSNVHVECFIISNQRIIKPINWFNGSSDDGFLDDRYNIFGEKYLNALTHHYCSADLFSFVDSTLIAQAGQRGCSSLSIRYLKKCLVNNAQCLNEYSLFVPYYLKDKETNDVELRYFFLPPPQVLSYTQRSSFNRYLQALLEEPLNGQFKYEDRIIERLKKTSQEATEYNQHDIAAEAQQLIGRLAEFSIRWLEEYAKVDTKRQLMQITEAKKNHNQYLAYTTQRLKSRAILLRQNDAQPCCAHFLDEFNEVKKTKHSKIERLDWLRENIADVKFGHAEEVGYFLSQVGDEFLLDCCYLLKEHLIHLDSMKYCYAALRPVQQLIVRRHLAYPENFYHFIDKKTEPKKQLDWVNWLSVFDDKKALFLAIGIAQCFEESYTIGIIQVQCMQKLFVRKLDWVNCLKYYLNYYLNKQKLIAVLPELLINDLLSTIKDLFLDDQEFIDVIDSHLTIGPDILKSCAKFLPINNPSEQHKHFIRNVLSKTETLQREILLDSVFGKNSNLAVHHYDIYDLFCDLDDKVVHKRDATSALGLSEEPRFFRRKTDCEFKPIDSLTVQPPGF